MLLRLGHSEETIVRETQVRDRTFRRWKLELERTGRIGKPPESRTGRHRVLTPEIEQALFAHVEANPQMSVDDMLWWLHEKYDLVVAGRTVRRVFERRNTSRQRLRGEVEDRGEEGMAMQLVAPISTAGFADERPSTLPQTTPYQSPYAPMTPAATAPGAVPEPSQSTTAEPAHDDAAEDAALQASLQKITKQKRAIEQKLKALRQRRAAPSPSHASPDPATAATAATARQARMLSALQSRSRKRSTITAGWVEGREIWPAGAQSVLQDAVWRYSGYDDEQLLEAVFGEVYGLVDTAGWERGVHDELLRERVRRKIASLRTRGHDSQNSAQGPGQRLLEGYQAVGIAGDTDREHRAGQGLVHGGNQAMGAEAEYPTAHAVERPQYHIPPQHPQRASRTSLEQDLQHAMAGADGSGNDEMTL